MKVFRVLLKKIENQKKQSEMLNTVVTPSTEKPYLLAEEYFLISEPLCGEVRPCNVQESQRDLVY